MKITKSKLRQIIQEELCLLSEQSTLASAVESLGDAMELIAQAVMPKYPSDSAEGIAETESVIQGELSGFIGVLEDQAAARPTGDDPSLPPGDYEIDDDLRREIQGSVDALAHEEVFRDASAEDVAMQSLDYVDHPPSLADEAYEIALAAAVGMGIPREGR